MSGEIYIVVLISGLLGVQALPHQNTLRVVGGNAVNITEVPFMARYCAVRSRECCGAAILSEMYLISTAECYYHFRDSYESTIAIVGTDQLYGDGEAYEIEEGYPHPQYLPFRREPSPDAVPSYPHPVPIPPQPHPVPIPPQPHPVPIPPQPHPVPIRRIQGYNVVVLKLVKKLSFSAKVQAIQLADTTLELSEGDMLDTMGFGSISPSIFDIEIPRQLHKVSVPFVSPEKCRLTFVDLTDTMVCAGSQYKGSSAFDEGGPLVYENQLVGVLSIPLTLGFRNSPSIYTYVPSVRDFIDAMMQKEEKR